MGFFSSKQKIPATGFYSQPAGYQQLYNSVLGNTNEGLEGINPAMFTSAPLSEGGTNGLNSIYNGFTPDSEQLQSDISMLSNPFDEYVVNGINREATGQNSLVNQYSTLAGQQGSNRSFLGTSDVEQNRLNNIGMFKRDNYNSAVNASLGSLTNSRRADANGAYQAGDNERSIETQDQLAPLQALLAQQGLLSGIPTSFGNFGTKQQTIKTGGGLSGLLDVAKLAAQAYMAYQTGGASSGAGVGSFGSAPPALY